jgi:hypothetical protein
MKEVQQQALSYTRVIPFDARMPFRENLFKCKFMNLDMLFSLKFIFQFE